MFFIYIGITSHKSIKRDIMQYLEIRINYL